LSAGNERGKEDLISVQNMEQMENHNIVTKRMQEARGTMKKKKGPLT
jgi:hypothetical protein